MTNDDIKEAARLLRDIEELEKLKLGREVTYYLAQESDNHRAVAYGYIPLTSISGPEALRIWALLLDARKARLNDLRAGC